VQEECIPAEKVFMAQLGETTQQRFSAHPPIVEELKTKARKLGLWNMFLPKGHYKESAGFTNLEYGLMAEVLAHGYLASEATNCAAPDTGNMEVLAKYGTEKQKKRWLEPLLEGKIRSAFLMTEPDVASSDATNIRMTILKEGNEYVLNGSVSYFSGERTSDLFLNLRRNGGLQAQETLVARSTLSWANLIQITNPSTSNNP
jgi:acyl-CoA dehydrogenase